MQGLRFLEVGGIGVKSLGFVISTRGRVQYSKDLQCMSRGVP